MLYNLYRPSDFAAVKGQDDVLQTLRKQSLSGRFGQAYLFAGHRGTGKTTIARILSKAVNCEHPSDNGPCLSCTSCLLAKESTDILELDAASNNGVDKIKEMVAQAKYRPVQLKHKIFIIDEVHNLSNAAFDVLLKPLEEPPSYVVFILCTTELHKIPVTIRSRCEEYVFHPIGSAPMRERLLEVLKDQGASCEEDALNLIVRNANGGLRDALGLTEQLIVSTDGHITTEAAKQKLGVLDTDRIIDMLEHIIRLDTCGTLECMSQMADDGKSASLITESTLDVLTDLITLKSTQDRNSVIHSSDYIERLMHMSSAISFERLYWMCDRYCDLRTAIRGSANPMMDVRLALIRISSHDIIKADPVSMAEEIALLKKETAFLKKRLEDAIKAGTVSCPSKNEAKLQEPVQDASSEGFFNAGDTPVPFADPDTEDDLFRISADSTGAVSGEEKRLIPAEPAVQGAGQSAGKGVVQSDRAEEESTMAAAGTEKQSGISGISSSDLFKILS